MKLIISRSDNTSLEFQERDDVRQYYWIKPNPNDNRNGVPFTVQMRPEHTIPFTDEIQWCIFKKNLTGDLQHDKQVWEDLRDTWDISKLHDHYDAINGTGNKNDLATIAVNIQMYANVVCGVEMLAKGIRDIPDGTLVLKIEVMDTDHLDLSATYDSHPHLVHHCVITHIAADGTHQRNPFPQNGGRTGKPVFTVLISDTPLYMELSDLEKLPIRSAIPNPYSPAWNWKKTL